MSNIIDFRKGPDPEDMIWVCECGCQSFMIREDFKAECQHCGLTQDDGQGEWRTVLPEPPAEAPPLDAETVKVTVIGNETMAMKRVLGLADVDTTAFVAVVQRDGLVRTWGDCIQTEDQRSWVDRRLDDIRRLLQP